MALYDFNAYNQLVGVDTKGVKSTYAYFADGLRKSKNVGSEATNFIYDGVNIIKENGTKYLRGIEIIKKSDNVYFAYNGQGDVATLRNSAGVLANYAFDAFGNQLEETEYTNNFLYRGEYTDSESGFIYLRERYMNPEIGRFVNADPLRYGNNWYVYADNNSILLIDPFGIAPTPEEAAAMAEHIYGNYDMTDPKKINDRIIAGWRLITVWEGSDSLKMGFYIKNTDDWKNPTEYAIVFKGTDNWSNWVNNAQAYTSDDSKDVWDAISYSRGFVNSHSQEITFVGHSKGGGEAVAAATATNKNAITFNAANFNFSKYGLTETNKAGIKNYYVEGEVLYSTIGAARFGTTMPLLPTQYWMVDTKIDFSIFGQKIYKEIKIPDPVKNHSMDAVKLGL